MLMKISTSDQFVFFFPSFLQRPACLAIRNIVARSTDLSASFLKLGVEELLNKVEPREGGDEAKAALRDLGCFVKFAEPFTGEVGCKLAN